MGVLRANKGGFCITFKKIGFKHAVHMHLFTVNHLFYLQRGLVTLNLLKKILLQTETLTLYFIIKWMFA